MSLATLPNWALCLLVFLCFVVAPATSHLLGPSESEAAQAVADISQERAAEFAAINQAPSDQRVAMKE